MFNNGLTLDKVCTDLIQMLFNIQSVKIIYFWKPVSGDFIRIISQVYLDAFPHPSLSPPQQRGPGPGDGRGRRADLHGPEPGRRVPALHRAHGLPRVRRRLGDGLRGQGTEAAEPGGRVLLTTVYLESIFYAALEVFT